MGFESLRKSVKGLIKDLEKVDATVNRILSRKDVRQFIISMNTNEQLFDDGINSLGVKLEDVRGDGYTDLTISIKESKGQPTDRVTLKDTGAFYESFRIKLNKDSFEIIADTNKGDTDLLQEWGRDILGLTDENLQRLIDKIRTELREVIRQKIHARFDAA